MTLNVLAEESTALRRLNLSVIEYQAVAWTGRVRANWVSG